MESIFFFVVAAVAVIMSIMVVTCKNPINSALSLVMTFFCLATFYVMLDAPFMAVTQVIVYAGAIMVLFTFVVMLLNAGREDQTLGSHAARRVGFPAVVVILGVLATVILKAQGLGVASLNSGITSTEDLSKVLFTELLLPFEVTSILILIAILGAVALARHGHGEPRDNGGEERTTGN